MKFFAIAAFLLIAALATVQATPGYQQPAQHGGHQQQHGGHQQQHGGHGASTPVRGGHGSVGHNGPSSHNTPSHHGHH